MEDIELRSEEVQEILGTPPAWLVRWGTLVWFLAVAALIGVSWFVEYPDSLEARIQINTATPPVEVIARTDGNIQSLFVTENQEVKSGDVLGVLQSTAAFADIQVLDSVVQRIKKMNPAELESLDVPKNLSLGELQGEYSTFLQNLDVHKFSRTDRTVNDAGRITSLRNQKLNLQKQLKLNESIRAKAKQELDLEQKSYERQKTLYAEGFISLSELQNHNKRLVEAQRNYEGTRNSDLTVQGEINNIEASISGVQFNTKETSTNTAINLTESISALWAGIEKWKQTFLVIAPIKGKVSLNARVFSEQQFVRSGEPVMTISPDGGTEIMGRLDLPIVGSGKVKPDQKVIIYLDNYPYEEFGTLQGRVVSKSAIPKENMYTIQIAFDKGLKTSQNTEIQFEQSLQGRAEIITDSRRLLARLMDKIFADK
jgi:multidrug resistance efflux pump